MPRGPRGPTRRERAADLLGPSFGPDQDFPASARKHFKDAYRLWSQSWILPLITDLIPELRPPKGT